MNERVQSKADPVPKSSFAPVHSHLLQRKCACGGTPGVDGQCTECRNKRLQAHPFPAPSIVDDVLRSPGQPLDPSTRTFMEPRLGHDFSKVRVHADAKAAESAGAVNALAYAVGRDVVFGAGQYVPKTVAGKRLLAHELTHVVQQGTGTQRLPDTLEATDPEDAAEQEAEMAAAAVMQGRASSQVRSSGTQIARQTASTNPSTTVEVTVPLGPNVCGLAQHNVIFPAVQQALIWLNRTIEQLTDYQLPLWILNVQRALDRHFRSTTPDTASKVLSRLNAIQTDLTSRDDLNVECHRSDEQLCHARAAYVIRNKNTMVFCPNFFEGSRSKQWQSQVIIHETAHALVGGDHITDRGYAADRVYPLLSTNEALTNAESFGLFVQEIGTGQMPGTQPPTDPTEDCPPDWQPLIRTAIALAQVWNRNAQGATSDRRPAQLAAWADLQRKHLGAPTDPTLNAAQAVYDQLQAKLRSPIDFQCEPEPIVEGGRCAAGDETYWYAIGSFHLCPAWKNKASDDDRTVSMLAGLYGYLAGVDPDTQRWRYASLAQDLTRRKT